MATKATAHESTGSFMKRALRGATFLGLEHAVHVGFVVALAGLLTAGIVTGIQLWTGNTTAVHVAADQWLMVSPVASVAGEAVMLAAALLVAGLFVYVLDVRTRAEYAKRRGFDKRLAYKAPLYVGVAVVWFVKVLAFVTLLYVGLYLLASLGRLSDTELTHLYESQVIPALVTLIVFSVAGWHLIRWAQGREHSEKFSVWAVIVGGALAVALFISATVTIQNPAETITIPSYPVPTDLY